MASHQAKSGVAAPIVATSLSTKHNETQTTENTSFVESKKRRKRTKRNESNASSLQSRDTISSTEIGQQAQRKPLVKETGGREAACLRRIKREWKDAVKLGIAYDWKEMRTLGTPSEKYAYVRIGPLGKNLLRWHFSVMGPTHSVYEGGIYHGRVLLPKTYPSSPPRIQVLTPSGRFITGEDICLSASSFHPESWTPRWTVLSLVEALRLHMLTTANEIGGKNDTPEQRRKYARASRRWHLGQIDHGLMVRDGIFPWKNETEDVMEKQGVVSSDGGVQLAVKRTPQERQIQKRIPQSSKLPTILFRAVVEVLTSPVRLCLLFLVTVFVILNRK